MNFSRFLAVLIYFLSLVVFLYGEEPPLPSGLGSQGLDSKEPDLPMGLEQSGKEEPNLPQGLGTEVDGREFAETNEKRNSLSSIINGFLEGRAGIRTQDDPEQKDASVGDLRLQVEIEKEFRGIIFSTTSDWLYDPVLDKYRVRLEEGKGFLDIREANLLIRPLEILDIKIGRQILTWGTGDLIFINDLFPKDWNSFIIGRDLEYLKAPSDAFKVSIFSKWFNLDTVYTPRFDADRFIDGARVSFFNPLFGRRTGRNNVVDTDKPDDWFKDDEISLRLYKNIQGYETALYAYRGFWKSPGGNNPATSRSTFPKLAVVGGSIRGVVGKGIGNVEIGYYDSRDDPDGDDLAIRNSESRFLIGYQQEVGHEFTAAFQYYVEHMLDHDNYRRTLPSGVPKADENRHIVTLRLTKLLLNQNLELSLMSLYSPSDGDAHIRPKMHYKVSDRWSAEFGTNIYFGIDDHTFYGQFKDNSSVYLSIRNNF